MRVRGVVHTHEVLHRHVRVALRRRERRVARASPGWRAGRRRRRACASRTCGAARAGAGRPGRRRARRSRARRARRRARTCRCPRTVRKSARGSCVRRFGCDHLGAHLEPRARAPRRTRCPRGTTRSLLPLPSTRAVAAREVHARRGRGRTPRSRAAPSRRAARGSRGRAAPPGASPRGASTTSFAASTDSSVGSPRRTLGVASSSAGHVAMTRAGAASASTCAPRPPCARSSSARACARASPSQPRSRYTSIARTSSSRRRRPLARERREPSRSSPYASTVRGDARRSPSRCRTNAADRLVERHAASATTRAARRRPIPRPRAATLGTRRAPLPLARLCVKRTRDLWDRARSEHSTPARGRLVGRRRRLLRVHAVPRASTCGSRSRWRRVFRLNRLWAFLGSRVSTNVALRVDRLLRRSSWRTALRTGAWAPLAPSRGPRPGRQLFGDWLLGTPLVGGALAALLGLARLLRRARRWRARELTPRTPDAPPPPSSGSRPSAPPAPTS